MRKWSNWCGVIALMAGQQLLAADLQVNIAGESEDGEVSCGWFDSAEGFPALPNPGHRQVLPAGSPATCVFHDLPPGQICGGGHE